jgi:hypothetical protein
MSQSVFMFVGAVVGAFVWLELREAAPLPNAFLCMVISAWLGIILCVFVRGEITIGGRGGRSPRTFIGLEAWAVAIAMLFLLAIFTLSIIDVEH